MMIRSERIAEFMLWSPEERELCVNIHRAMNSETKTVETKSVREDKPRRRRRVIVKRENSCKPWSDDEDLTILQVVEEYGHNERAWGMLSRELKRTRKAVSVRYYGVLMKANQQADGKENS